MSDPINEPMPADQHILIVDDEAINRELYSAYFREEGYSVSGASNRVEVFECIRGRHPDLILLDIRLKGESGLDILQEIKGDDSLRYIYVVMVTAHLKSSDEQARGLELGADGYITRPIERRELVARVNAFLRHKGTIDRLRRSESRFRKIIERNPDAMLVVDEDGRIRFTNPASEDVFQLTMDDLLSRTFGYPIVKGEHTEISIVRKDGGDSVAEMRSIDIDWEEEPAFLASVRDISHLKRTEDALRRQTAELMAVNRLGNTMATHLEMEEAVDIALRGILETVESDAAVIFLKDGSRLILEEVVPAGVEKRLAPIQEHRVGECLCGLAVEERKSLFSESIDTDSRCTWQECRRAGIRSFAAIPLIHGNEVIGVLGLASDTKRDFEEDRRFLETLANQVSLALVNSKLYEEVQRELAERTRAEEQIRRNLREKEVLIRELYHRTKNNMQVISAMVQMKKYTFEDPELQAALQDVTDKIMAMALVHQKLYESQDLSSLNLHDYFTELMVLVRHGILSETGGITLRYEGEDLPVLIDTAIPLGLVLNETVTNAAKHAFPDEWTGEICVRLWVDDDDALRLTITDDGIGLPESFSIERDARLGLQTVYALVEKQLGGTVEIDGRDGVRYEVTIPAEIYQSRV